MNNALQTSSAAAAGPSRTVTLTGTPPAASPPDEVGILRLRPQPRSRSPHTANNAPRRVVWSQETVDNEGLGRKKSKICCIYHKPKAFDESSDESSPSASSSSSESTSSSDDSESEPDSSPNTDGPNLSQAIKQKAKQRKHHHHHGEACDAHSSASKSRAKAKAKSKTRFSASTQTITITEQPQQQQDHSEASEHDDHNQHDQLKFKPNAYERGTR